MDLSGTAWELATLSGSDLLLGSAITLEFTDEEVSGLAGCNHYGGSYRVSGSSLTISDVFATEMACPEPPGVLEQEGDYLAALNVAASYLLTGNQLEIRDEAGGVFLLFVKTEFQYSNLTAHWLGIIVARACGTDLKSFGQEHLFDPLGAEIGDWKKDLDGYNWAAGEIHVSARDAAKFGMLFLNDGH